MVYFSNGHITIRNMEYEDAQAITDAEIEQGWDATVGYINIYPNNTWGAFGGNGIGYVDSIHI